MKRKIDGKTIILFAVVIIVIVYILVFPSLKDKYCENKAGNCCSYYHKSKLWNIIPATCSYHAKLICADCGDLTDKPTYDNLIVFSPQDISIKEKGRQDVQVGFLNDHPTAKYWLMEVIDPNGIKCGLSPAANTICGTVPVTYNMKAFSLDRDEVTGWYSIFQPKTGTVQSLAPGETSVPVIFTVKFCAVNSLTDTSCPDTPIAEYTKQLYIEVKK